MRRKWDAQTKARIVLKGLMGGVVMDVCREHDIRPGLYYKWREYFLANAARVFEPPARRRDVAVLVEENEKLKRLVGSLTLRLDDGENHR